MKEALMSESKEGAVFVNFDELEQGLKTGNIEFGTYFGGDRDMPRYLYYFRQGDNPRFTSGLATILRQLPRKTIQESHPRLAGTLTEIEKSGSYYGWIEEKFGTVYQWLPAVRPWDIKLPTLDPKMDEYDYHRSLVKNMAVIRDWYGPPNMITHSDPPTIDYEGPHDGFKQHAVDNPFIDHELLAESITSRRERGKIGFGLPEGLAGVYKMRLESTKGIPEKVRTMATLLGIPLSEISTDKDGNTPNIAKQLIRKFGIDPRNPVFSEFGYQLDPQDFCLVISNNPLDILHSSTEKPWHSCACQDTSHDHSPVARRFQKGPYGDIAAGSSIGYLLDNRGNFVGRSILRVGIDEEEKEKTGVLKLGIAIENFYGDVNFKRIATKSLASIMEIVGIPTQKSSQILTPPISNLIFPDNGIDVVNEDKVNPTHGYRILRYDGND